MSHYRHCCDWQSGLNLAAPRHKRMVKFTYLFQPPVLRAFYPRMILPRMVLRRSIALPSSTELYDQTDGRWLFNAVPQQAIRNVKFDVSELLRLSCSSVNAKECVSMIKVAEGSFNKVFRISCDNGKSVIARIPSSCMFGSGVSMAVASEVATLYFAASINIRVPRVLAWSKDTITNSVGWPFILLEDVGGVDLEREWLEPETRGAPVAKLLTRISNAMNKMTVPSFSQLGSLYFADDFPNDRAPLRPIHAHVLPEVQEKLRVGPIADFLWWRPYHDEPDFDRGPWDTLEQYVIAAARLERRAVERHREDSTSLAYTNSSLEDLTEIDQLLDKVEALAPRLQDVIERCSPHPSRFMQNALMHPDIRAANIMVQKLTHENAQARMEDPVLIDWQGSAVLPLALQYDTPNLVKYEPRVFRHDGSPLLEVTGVDEVPWPQRFENMSFEEQEIVRAEHRIAMRYFRWNETMLKVSAYAHLLAFGLHHYLQVLSQGILRACADGPHGLRTILVGMQLAWNDEAWGPCPYTIEKEILQRFQRDQEKNKRYDTAVEELMDKLMCARDGWIMHKDYEAAEKQLEVEKMYWNEEICGGPFPFEDGRWGLFLR